MMRSKGSSYVVDFDLFNSTYSCDDTPLCSAKTWLKTQKNSRRRGSSSSSSSSSSSGSSDEAARRRKTEKKHQREDENDETRGIDNRDDVNCPIVIGTSDSRAITATGGNQQGINEFSVVTS